MLQPHIANHQINNQKPFPSPQLFRRVPFGDFSGNEFIGRGRGEGGGGLISVFPTYVVFETSQHRPCTSTLQDQITITSTCNCLSAQVFFATRKRLQGKNCQCHEEEMFTKIYLLTPLPHIPLHITSVVWRYPNVTHATALFDSADKQNISYVAASMFVVCALHCSLSLCPDLSCVDTSLCREPAHHRQKELFSRDKDPPLLRCYATQEIEAGGFYITKFGLIKGNPRILFGCVDFLL